MKKKKSLSLLFTQNISGMCHITAPSSKVSVEGTLYMKEQKYYICNEIYDLIEPFCVALTNFSKQSTPYVHLYSQMFILRNVLRFFLFQYLQFNHWKLVFLLHTLCQN